MAKYRGDEDRDFVQSKFNTESFPTINVIKGGKATKYESRTAASRRLACARLNWGVRWVALALRGVSCVSRRGWWRFYAVAPAGISTTSLIAIS